MKTKIEQVIIEKQDLLEEWNIRFGVMALDDMLDHIKSEFINPDEAFVIGYMIGVNAEKEREVR